MPGKRAYVALAQRVNVQGAQVERGKLLRRVFLRAGKQGEETRPEEKVVEEACKNRARRRVVGLDTVAHQDRGQELLLRHPCPGNEVKTEAQAEIFQD